MIGPGDISDALEAIVDIATESAPDGSAIRLIDEMLIIRALNRFHGDQSKSGRWLGITRYAVRYRMEKYGLR